MKKYTDSDFGTLEKRVTQCEMVNDRGRCRDCGNPWWFDLPQSWVCSTCCKSHGKSESEKEAWQPKQTPSLKGE